MERYKVTLSQKGSAEIRAIIQYIAVNLREPCHSQEHTAPL